MTDRELLELAAKAAGHAITGWNTQSGTDVAVLSDGSYWQPLLKNGLTDCMGDALRLAVKVLNWPHGGCAFNNAVSAMYAVGQLPKDPYAATRRAIVRAAAEIGKGMK